MRASWSLRRTPLLYDIRPLSSVSSLTLLQTRRDTNTWTIGKAIRKITLPIESRTRGTAAIEELLKTCTPATFGKRGKEVLDASYRKAIKLDSDQFSTTFNPYEVGIIDAISQSLLPGIAKPFSDETSQYEEHLGVIAELYKLNVGIPRWTSGNRNDSGPWRPWWSKVDVLS